MTSADKLRYQRIPLTHGSGSIPAAGFGTLIPDPVATKEAVKTALEVGFRHLDCAERYRNEAAVGEAIQAAFEAETLRRDELFVTTKLWNTNHRPERVRHAFDASRRRLQLETIDCYLIHTPFAFRPGDDQDPRDEDGQVVYDPGVTLAETWGRSSAWSTRVTASRSDYRMLPWRRCTRSLRLRGSNRRWCK